MKKETDQIIKASHIRTILNHINPTTETLVLFDLDRTLIKPETVENFEFLLATKALKRLLKGSPSLSAQEDAFMSLLQEEKIIMKPIEDETADIVKAIQDRNIVTWCITARFPSLEKHTVEHLQSSAIDFSLSKFAEYEVEFDTEYPGTFKSGIVFCGRGNNKGDILITLLKELSYQPEKIIFIDDHLHNLISVQDAAAIHDIPFLGIHYDRLKPFDNHQFLAQLSALMHTD